MPLGKPWRQQLRCSEEGAPVSLCLTAVPKPSPRVAGSRTCRNAGRRLSTSLFSGTHHSTLSPLPLILLLLCSRAASSSGSRYRPTSVESPEDESRAVAFYVQNAKREKQHVRRTEERNYRPKQAAGPAVEPTTDTSEPHPAQERQLANRR